jgi:hypothetical protein
MPNLTRQSEQNDETILLTAAEVRHHVLKPSVHTCHTTSISHLAGGGQITATIDSKNIMLFLLFFLINDFSRNFMGQEYDHE